jgi:hypothetical protein
VFLTFIVHLILGQQQGAPLLFNNSIQPQPLHKDRNHRKVVDADHLVVALLATAQASYFTFDRQVPLGGEPCSSLIKNLGRLQQQASTLTDFFLILEPVVRQ